MSKERVAVLGASHKPERYSNMAVRALVANGHTVLPVNPAQKVIEGLEVYPRLEDVPAPIDTITLYVNPSQGEALQDAIAAANPKRVILNPGAESTTLSSFLVSKGIEVIEGCTLVMLRAGTF